MRYFLLKTCLFVSLATGIFLYALSRADGYTDPFYVRFTTPQQTSMILGTSRAAQGLIPSVFDSILGANMYNYSFTVAHSPYGRLYLESIKQKIKKGDKPGTFILSVDPWSISSRTENPEDSLNFRENKRELSFPWSTTSKPNLPYLFKAMKGKYFYTIYRRNKTGGPLFLHDDGWLEVKVSMTPEEVQKRTDKKVIEYITVAAPQSKVSQNRLAYLKRTIHFLKRYGKVYLVRIPIHPRIMKIEDKFMPDFDNVIADAVSLADGYLDLTPNNTSYQYTDGNHINRRSAPDLSKDVALWIKKLH